MPRTWRNGCELPQPKLSKQGQVAELFRSLEDCLTLFQLFSRTVDRFASSSHPFGSLVRQFAGADGRFGHDNCRFDVTGKGFGVA